MVPLTRRLTAPLIDTILRINRNIAATSITRLIRCIEPQENGNLVDSLNFLVKILRYHLGVDPALVQMEFVMSTAVLDPRLTVVADNR